ncbi:MAG: hypothetical protein KFW07_01375 [Mycoplasmataceae bacterium]|nr:hypothetical protein [Mycoplasmataceae bacterium]
MSDNNRKLTLTTAIDPELLNSIYAEEDIIFNITILTVDYKPLELVLNTSFNQKTNKSMSDIITIYDVAALVVKYYKDGDDSKDPQTKFIMAQEVIRVSNNLGDLVMLNGKFDIIPDRMLVEVYKNFSNLKTVNLEELEDILEITKNQPSLKAYNQLSNYFSAENYSKNNNVFKLLQHQNDVVKVSKKVLLKSIVAWEIRK